MAKHRIIPRSEWGAKYGYGPYKRALGNLEKWLHHSVTIAPDTVPPFTDDYAAIRQIERIGHQRFGSYGFPYTFAITPAGLIFEGHPIERVGAHTQGHNTAGAGIVLVGNYETSKPTQAQLEAVAWLLQHGVAKRWWKTTKLNGGHRDTKATACPGRHAYAAIDDINRLAARGVDDTASRDDDRKPVDDGKVKVDGKWGSSTTKALQRDLGSKYKDGEVSRQNAHWRGANPGLTTGWEWFSSRAKYKAGSPFIEDFQHLLNKLGYRVGTADGLAGEKFFKGLQRWLDDLGLYDGKHDGELWKPSTTIEALQRAHNRGLVAKAAKEAGIR